MNTTFHERLQAVAKLKKLDQADLAKGIGVDSAAINRWWNGKIIPRPKSIRAIADFFECDVDWLSEGVGEPFGKIKLARIGAAALKEQPPNTRESENEEAIIPKSDEWAEFVTHHKPRLVPLISWVSAGDWSEVEDPFNPGHAEKWFSTTATQNPHAFALTIHGDSMEPEFKEGEVIVVDPGKQAENGDYIIAKNGDDATFKRLFIDGDRVYLVPLNERYQPRDMTGVHFRVVGVVVQKFKNYG